MTDTTKAPKETEGFSAEEKAAVKERARELKSANSKADGERDLRQKIADMPEPDRSMAERVDAVVMAAGPDLERKTYYGMPAYAKDGKTICFFKPKSKFKVRYATFEFQPDAMVDDGTMWPVAFALTELTPANEARITELVEKAVR
jgi:uncharacterized protein YdhG (YjbR/CyaY superfamily)